MLRDSSSHQTVFVCGVHLAGPHEVVWLVSLPVAAEVARRRMQQGTRQHLDRLAAVAHAATILTLSDGEQALVDGTEIGDGMIVSEKVLFYGIIFVYWLPLIAISGWWVTDSAQHAHPATTWIKIGIAAVLLAIYAAMLIAVEWRFVILSNDSPYFVFYIYTFWTMTVAIGPLCVGSIVGGFVGIYLRSRIRLSR